MSILSLFCALYQSQSSNKSVWMQFYLFFWIHFQLPLSKKTFKEVWLFVAPYALETIFFENIWSWRRILPKINHALRRWINASSVWLSHHYRVLQEWLKKYACSFKVSDHLSSLEVFEISLGVFTCSILASILTILTSIEPILEKCVNLQM